jgi:hypothetical protein
MVDCEAIEGMLDKFNMTQQEFRDAYNAHYNLKSGGRPNVQKARPLLKTPKA